MNINGNIEAVRQQIIAGNTALGDEIGRDGLSAIFTGMRTASGEVTPEWQKLMEHFAKTPAELQRLCGQDTDFNNSKWGVFCLAYIAGDSTCTSETAMETGARRSIMMHDKLQGNTDMQDNLDAVSTSAGIQDAPENNEVNEDADHSEAKAKSVDLAEFKDSDSRFTDLLK